MKVTVIGSGTMGQGIAQTAANAGWDVDLTDIDPATLKQAGKNIRYYLERYESKGKIGKGDAAAIFHRITFKQSEIECPESDLVIEAIAEDLQTKQKLFQSIKSDKNINTLFATNTSSLSITEIASGLKNPSNLLGIHFFNPAPLMPLVEIVPAEQTSVTAIKQARKWMTQWGKVSVQTRDTPGFIVNRVARPFYNEALRILEEGLAAVRTIDQAMVQLGGFRMGPFQLMDLIGIDVNYRVTESIWRATYFEPRYRPSAIQKRMIEAGQLGKKTGQGFYSYPGEDAGIFTISSDIHSWILDRILFMLINEAAEAVYYSIASVDDIEKAMCLGAGYPKGLLKWANETGISEVVAGLNRLYNNYHEERYRCSPLLRKMAEENKIFEITT